MAPSSIIPGHGSRGTPATGSRPDRHDNEQRGRSALPRRPEATVRYILRADDKN